jgi:hypothetical protein
MKFLVLCLVAGAGFFVYRHQTKPSPAAEAYLKFAEARAYRNFGAARELATGSALNGLSAHEAMQNRRVGLPMAGVSAAELTRELAGSVAGVKHSFESREKSEDGRSENLVVEYKVCRDKPGTGGLKGVSCRPFRHHVQMCDEGGWKVCSFVEEPLQ